MKELTKQDVDKILAQHNLERGKKVVIPATGENAHAAALALQTASQVVNSKDHIPTDEFADVIIDSFALWTGYDLHKLIEGSRKKDGYALFLTDLSVKDEDLRIIKDSWNVIKTKYQPLLESERFSTEKKDKDYPTEEKNKISICQRIQMAIDGVENGKMKTIDCNNFIDRVCAGYYGKQINNKEQTQEKQ